ncbi:uncharacterized protein B0H18DRAFT_949747 [Fomitopsis serialis]|uniref:uncharacterized protein n=1 Tax=Fomitopsis serialis TaxID=139415 RepID=UPI002007BDF5|nr:uncharacterized protein B0H18DRAFT_949747 [Neoantrodia serialis]KAH9938384.1 hypothetical protein B0H18DRAFT_949747 [Neoantrodia serialis]
MSKPAIVPDLSTAGIAVDPRTLERVIPESRRPDGSVRKQIKIRPGFTPQEDVRRFRGSRQQQLDATALPKGHVIGWTPPPTSSAPKPGVAASAAQTKAAKKNEKRKEKRKEKREVETVKDSWEDEDEELPGTGAQDGSHSADKPNWAAAPETKKSVAVKEKGATSPSADGDAQLAEKLEKLEV